MDSQINKYKKTENKMLLNRYETTQCSYYIGKWKHNSHIKRARQMPNEKNKMLTERERAMAGWIEKYGRITNDFYLGWLK